MRNFTFCKSGFSRLIFLIVFLLLTAHSASAQFFTKHYIAPAPWQYFSRANEIIIATNSTTPVSFTITKSDGSAVSLTKDGTSISSNSLTTVKGTPAVYRFVGDPNTDALTYNSAGTVYNDRGIIVTSTTSGGAISVNLRNIASDAIGGGGDSRIKGNASLTSFGDAGIGVEFRVGYYRNMGTSDQERPFYSVMAIGNNTQVKVNGSVATTLKAGQSYLFNAAIGSLVESSGPVVMNTGVRIDTPEACGDGTFDQLPPTSVLGTEYFLERGKGNNTAEQTTVVVTKDNTVLTITTYGTNGNVVGSPIVTSSLNAGQSYTFRNGVSGTAFTSSRISATNNVAVYSGTADGCEVDISTIAPVSECGGSNFVETSAFKGYTNASLDYFGYVLLKSVSNKVFINGTDLEQTLHTTRRQLGTTGWYIIDFTRDQIGNPNTISLNSDSKLTVSIAQQGNGYSMAAFFSNFAQQPSAPKETYIGVAGCLKQSAKLTTDANFAPYQWRYNGTVIPGETSNTITVTKTGSYTVTSTLSCGVSSQSTPITVTLCSDVTVENSVNVSSQCVGSDVVFTVTAKNLGPSNAEGVSVTDKLPSGYTYVSSVASKGTSYDNTSGIWTISGLDSGASAVLTITATVKDTGAYSNTATITSSNVDDPTGNNTATAMITANTLPVAATLAANSPVCSGSNAVFTISGTSGNAVTYTGAASGTVTIGSDGKAIVTVSNVTSNSTLNLTNVSNGTCSRALAVSATVTVNPLPATPTISAASTGTTFCSGGSVVLTSSAGSGNQWYKDGVAIPSATNKTYSATTSGSYTVTTNNGNCTSVASAGTVVTVNSLPVALSLTGSTICVSPGGNGTISSSTSANGVNYQLYDSSNATVQSAKTGNGSALEWSNLSAANGYYVIATNTSNCTSKSNVVNVTTNPNPTISIGGILTACLTTTLTTTTNANSPTYVWYKNNDIISGETSSSLVVNSDGDYKVKVKNTVTGCEQTSAVSTVNVSDTEKPVKPTLADITGECSATVTAPTTTDNCKGTVTGTTTDPLTYNAQGTYTINWSFSDGNGNVETATQKVIIKDTQKPVKPTLADVTGECSATVTAPTTTDNCAGTVTGTTTDPLTYNAQGTYTINWSFSDGNGNVETDTQKVIIKDMQKPVKPTLADITGECSATVTAPTTTDNCKGTVTGTTTDPLTYNAQGTYTINWSFSDGNGNVETATQKVIIKDTQKPVKPTLADATGECSVTVTAPTTTDNCKGAVTGTTTDPLTYSAQGTYTINWSFSDGNGNVETAIQKVIIKDTQKPLITCPSAVVVSVDANSCTASGVALGTPVTSDNCTGAVTVTNNAPTSFPIGNTTVTWTATDAAGNTQTCIQTVKVIGIIEANDDTISASNGVSGGTVISNIFDNDVLNCNKVNINDVDVTINGSLPSVLDFNSTTGTVSVKPNTPTGTYTFDYSICEIANNGNCNSATVTVKIVNDLAAVKDDFGTKSSGSTAAVVGNVKTNDTLDGAFVTSGNTVVTIDSSGPLSVDADGDVTLAANTPSGTYSITYEICEKSANPSNCKTAVAEVKVVNTIDAVLDTIDPINGNIGGTTVSLIGNDTLNGKQAAIGINSGEVAINIVGTLPSGLTLNASGTITVAPNTPKGNYNIEYRICEIGVVPSNCDSVTITVPVTAGNLVANADEITSVLGSNVPQTLGKNVFDNDTKNAQPLNPSDVTLKTTAADPKGYLSVDANGNIVLGANPPAGDYELTYEICEKLNPDNCSSNTVKVTVGLPVIDAVEDVIASINGNIGGKTIALTANDKLKGNAIVVGTAAGEVKFEIIGTLPSGLTLNSDYTITVAPNTPKGNYNVEYKICENTNPTNCDSVTITVPVTAGNLVANADEIPSVLGSNVPQTLGKNVFDNDTKNAQPLNPSDVTLKTTAADPKGYLSVDADGNIVLGANSPAGDYELTYEICEKLNPDNCSSNTVKVTVGTPIIDAVVDVITPINGNIGGTTISLTANDKLNGSPITVGTAPGEVKFEIIGTLPTGLTLNSDYTITVAPNTPAADYNVEYKICENTNPTNCDSVITVVKVTGGNLVANEDLVPSAVGVNVPQKVINVFENDTKDGNKLTPSDVDLKVTQADPKGYLTVDTDGNVVLAPSAPAGEYELTYTICEKLNPNNCDSNTVKVTVAEPKMTVVANSYCSNNVPYVNYTVSPENFTANNLLTVKWIDSNNNVVATQTNLPLSGNILWPGAEIDINQNGTDWPGWILNNGIWSEGADGFEATRNGVKIEFSLNPTVTVSVAYPPATPDCNARPTFSIKANNDEAGPVNVKKGADANINIFENDLLNGAKIKASEVVLSVPVVHPNITLNADGSINIAANTADGVYELTYQICEAANTSNCSQAVIKITVDNVADPAPPTTNEITLNNDNDVSADGINGSLEFVNVLENDLINGQPINPADVIVKPVTESPYFEWNADGTVNVKPNTPGGNYPLTYQVCEKANGTNCSTAVLNVFVEVPAISVIKTAVFNDENKSGFANAGETITYKFTVTNTGNVPLVGITINDPLPGVVVSGQAINLGVNESNETNFTAVYKITQEDINRGSVSNQATVKGSSVRGVVVEDQSDDASNSGDSPTVLDLNGCSIKVMNAFSPNGDDKNARFYIRGIECYPDNTVEIYNRWGVLVFNIDQYNNNDRVFVGYSNGRSTIKQTDGLPVGTYFYILKYKDSAQKSHQESGYLYLNK
ncbi:gliding motility-associated C-terminal domain-containing protein [Flavobacterium sp. GN10]|uniref:Gliding motility-associated C-terminal domain-containing protein n=1 Tax=Flavobacterium tagetis TaxID=2801336 RepID=A0ABS1K8Z7_9FLAO|nr:gliding motility-associated C-terminal domain-containing protein [Flavobacterium tagetis]MBL0735617.1 gliding motility-associated C-terminal domain-containing protein [Flavobacterium tagetis]